MPKNKSLALGAIVIAKRNIGTLAKQGDRGVVFEVYERPWARGGETPGPGVSILWANGDYDGFSPDDVALCVSDTGKSDPTASAYAFENVGRLMDDYRRGRFNAALGLPQGQSPTQRAMRHAQDA